MICKRQRICDMIVTGRTKKSSCLSVTIHQVLLVLQAANHTAAVRPLGCSNNNNNNFYCSCEQEL